MIETWHMRIERYIAEGRTVSGGKSDETAKGAEKDSAGFTSLLHNVFSTQFGKQSDILQFLTGKLTDEVNRGGSGFAPDALAAARTSATDTITQQHEDAIKAAQTRQFIQGGRDLPSGVNAQINAGIDTAAARQNSQAQNDITLQNENLRQQNYWKALGGLSGVASEENPLGYAGAANQGASATAGLSQAVTASQSAGFMNHFTNSLGDQLGKAAGGGKTGIQGLYGG